MPVSQIDWPCDNSERRDINMDPFEDRFERLDTRATTPFYKDEMAYLQVQFLVSIFRKFYAFRIVESINSYLSGMVTRYSSNPALEALNTPAQYSLCHTGRLAIISYLNSIFSDISETILYHEL